MNKPGAARCRVCGRKLRPTTTRAPAAPVVLQRVMSGEVFTAVVGEVEDVPKPPAVEPRGVAVEVPRDEREEARQALAAIAERLRDRAASAGQRFKPYEPAGGRRADTPEAKKAVARHLEAAAAAFRERHFEDAIEHLLRAIAKEDGDPRTWTLLGEAYLRMKRPYKAAVGFLRALELNTEAESAWLGLARAMRLAEDYPGALEVLDRIVERNPSFVEAWSERGLVLESLENLSEAVKSFARTLELRPDHPTARERYEALAQKLETKQGPPASEAPAARSPEDEGSELPDFADLMAHPTPEGTSSPTAAERAVRPPRVRTYVEGLDEGLGGGIPWGHVVLIQGAPGTMKSSLGFSILLQNAARDGLHGLYLSLEERTSSLLKQMGSLGLPLRVDRGSLVVLDPRTAKGLLSERKDWIEAFREALAAIEREKGLDLVVIDSLEALEVLAKFKDRRRELYRLFEWLRDLGATSFVVTERPDFVIGGHVLQGRWDEDFLADGILHLRQHLVSDLEVQRRLRVVKMRGTRHETGYMALVLDEGRFKVTRAMSP